MKLSVKLGFVLVALLWLGAEQDGVRASDLTCALWQCEVGGSRCCIGDQFVYDCEEYCGECVSGGGAWEGRCEPDQGGDGTICQCESSR